MLQRKAMRPSFRHDAEVVELFAAEAGHERHSSGVGAVELAEYGPDPGVDLEAVGVGTLRYWRHLGAGPRSFKIGRHVRYWRADLVLWLTKQTNRPQNHH